MQQPVQHHRAVVEKVSEEGLKGDEFFTQFIEDRNLALGDSNIFHTKKDCLLTVADVAEGTQAFAVSAWKAALMS